MSEALVYSAIAAYAVALVAFAVDLAGGRTAPEPRERARRARRACGLAPPAATCRREAATVADRDHGRDRSPTPAATGRGGAGGRRRAGGIGATVFVLATLLHLASVLTRGVSVRRVPWSDAYEFAVTGSVAVSLVYLVMLRQGRQWRWLGTFVVLPVSLTLVLATQLFPTEPSALSPALQSFWLVVHVSIAILSSALLTIGFSLAVVQLVQHRAEAAVAAGGQASRLLQRVPSARQLEQSSFQVHAVAFVLWTFTVVAGAIWAAEAWGRYWGWDPKEVWSFVIWVVYAAYLHARSTAGWAGPRSAWIAVLGFACLLFNFLGVNYLFVGNHSYAL